MKSSHFRSWMTELSHAVDQLEPHFTLKLTVRFSVGTNCTSTSILFMTVYILNDVPELIIKLPFLI